MPADYQENHRPDQLAQVAIISGLQPDDIDTWAVVVIRPSGLPKVATYMCCRGHAAGMLAAVSSDLMTDVATIGHVLSS